MPLQNQFRNVVKRASNRIMPDHERSQVKHISWIINQYLNYAIDAILHGYVINVYHKCGICLAKLSLVYSKEPVVKKSQRRRFMFSPKAYGYNFYLSITGKSIDDEHYDFCISNELKQRIEEKLNTDAIYEFIKP